LLDEIERLGHILFVLDELLKLSLLLIDIVDRFLGLLNVLLLLDKTVMLRPHVFLELGGALLSLRQIFLQLGEHLGCGT
jgi:hypothetical protein